MYLFFVMVKRISRAGGNGLAAVAVVQFCGHGWDKNIDNNDQIDWGGDFDDFDSEHWENHYDTPQSLLEEEIERSVKEEQEDFEAEYYDQYDEETD